MRSQYNRWNCINPGLLSTFCQHTGNPRAEVMGVSSSDAKGRAAKEKHDNRERSLSGRANL
jgi:hypothetical protein